MKSQWWTQVSRSYYSWCQLGENAKYEGCSYPDPSNSCLFQIPPLLWGRGHAGKPHRAVKFISRTKADATLAALCPRSAFAIALGHPAFNSKYVTSAHDLPVEGSSVILGNTCKRLQVTAISISNKPVELFSCKDTQSLRLKSQANLKRKKKRIPKVIPMTETSSTTDRVEVTLGLDVVHAHCTHTVLVTDQV